jgi:hypothetical protein
LLIVGHSYGISATVNQSMETSKGSVDKSILFLLDDVSIDVQEAQIKLKSGNTTGTLMSLDDASTTLSQLFAILSPEIHNMAKQNVTNMFLSNNSNSTMMH